jgi:hypothetical protein
LRKQFVIRYIFSKYSREAHPVEILPALPAKEVQKPLPKNSSSEITIIFLNDIANDIVYPSFLTVLFITGYSTITRAIDRR